MKFCKSHEMGNHGHEFMKNIFEELNITDEQKDKIIQIKKIGKKEKMKLAVKYIFGKADFESLLDMIPEKIGEIEEILTQEQKDKAKKMMMEEHQKFFAHKLFMLKDNIKELIEVTELNEIQRDQAEKLFNLAIEHENCEEIFKLKAEFKASLSEEQKDKIFEYIKLNTHVGEFLKELNISTEQKDKFMELHEKVCSSKPEVCKKFKDGEMSFSDMAKEKIAMIKEMKAVLNPEQIKKIKAMHKSHCHGHKFHGSRHGHSGCC